MRSGTSNAGEAFELLATRRAADSSYAALVKLVSEAERERAPFVRLADRYAVVFLLVTVVLAGLAWALSGDPVRAVAVLVVATPCPLILAAPIALVAGLSRAARAGVIIKGGTAIERLGDARTRPARQDRNADRGQRPACARSSRSTGSRPTRCCVWRRRSTSSRRTCSPSGSSPTRSAAGCASSRRATCASRPARASPERSPGARPRRQRERS